MEKTTLEKRILKVMLISLGIFILCVVSTAMVNIDALQWITIPLGFFSLISSIWMTIWFIIKYLDIDMGTSHY